MGMKEGEKNRKTKVDAKATEMTKRLASLVPAVHGTLTLKSN